MWSECVPARNIARPQPLLCFSSLKPAESVSESERVGEEAGIEVLPSKCDISPLGALRQSFICQSKGSNLIGSIDIIEDKRIFNPPAASIEKVRPSLKPM